MMRGWAQRKDTNLSSIDAPVRFCHKPKTGWSLRRKEVRSVFATSKPVSEVFCMHVLDHLYSAGISTCHCRPQCKYRSARPCRHCLLLRHVCSSILNSRPENASIVPLRRAQSCQPAVSHTLGGAGNRYPLGPARIDGGLEQPRLPLCLLVKEYCGSVGLLDSQRSCSIKWWSLPHSRESSNKLPEVILNVTSTERRISDQGSIIRPSLRMAT